MSSAVGYASQMFCVSNLFCLLVSVQPISEWTVGNVLEWMAAVNLYRYVELFRDKQITGRDLLAMDESMLMVSFAWISNSCTLLRMMPAD